jgi:NitT/TauT family transport system permease protein
MQRPNRPGRRRRRFALGGHISGTEFLAVATLVFVALALLWWGATAAGLVRPLFLPSPGQVVARLADLWRSGQLAADVSVSIYRITVGFLISTALALPIGVVIGSYRIWEAAIEPFVDFIRYMPPLGAARLHQSRPHA